LRFLSWHDPLTGLFNRRHFEEELRRLDAGAPRSVALVVCDMDDLKRVNDRLGHEAGDELLVAAARLLQGCVRDGDFVARIGGDEFALVLPGAGAPAAERVCARIRQAQPKRDAHSLGELALSLGYAVGNAAEATMSELYRAADAAMYDDKRERKRGVGVGDGRA
jgi:diguanylate cyclase (GGDEF)-like protein